MDEMIERGMGWLPDYPDFRDYTADRIEIAPRLQALGQDVPVNAMLKKVGAEPVKATLPPSVDLRKSFSLVPIEDQGALGSCTAQAGIGLVEYFESRAFGRHIDASRLFLYKVTRNLLHLTGDTGAYLRTTMQSLVLFGAPPEEYWKYKIPDFDKEPPAFCYAFAQNYKAISYFRLDPPTTPRDELLARIKASLAVGLSSMFGFSVYSSYRQANTTGKIPYPTPGESRVGGHAVIAAGYDDKMKIKNANPGATATTGALLIRNSWGKDWGEEGYGWLPYEYVLNGLAIDWWSLLRSEWVDSGQFG